MIPSIFINVLLILLKDPEGSWYRRLGELSEAEKKPAEAVKKPSRKWVWAIVA
jgi:hypothetical protein